jgi:hypothetical protein
MPKMPDRKAVPIIRRDREKAMSAVMGGRYGRLIQCSNIW